MTKRAVRAVADTIMEAGVGVLARPGRAWMTIVGMMVGVAALVATLGIAQSAGYHIVARLHVLEGTLVRVSADRVGGAEFGIPQEADRSVRRLNGVLSAGALSRREGGAEITTLHGGGAASRTAHLDVAVASHGLASTLEWEMAAGRFFDPLLDVAPFRAAVLGSGAARLLGMEAVRPGRTAVFIDGAPYSVVGILGASGGEPSVPNTVLVSAGSAKSEAGAAPDTLYVRTERGAAGVVAGQVATVVNPNHSQQLRVSAAPSASELREAVESDVNQLFVTLGIVAVVVAAIGISNTTLVAVMERRNAIGLRRALGATRRRIGAEFLTESTLLGLVGGLLGASIGLIAVVAAATRRGWLPVVDFDVALLGPALGAAGGLIAGIYPAQKAAALEPAWALRGG